MRGVNSVLVAERACAASLLLLNYVDDLVFALSWVWANLKGLFLHTYSITVDIDLVWVVIAGEIVLFDQRESWHWSTREDQVLKRDHRVSLWWDEGPVLVPEGLGLVVWHVVSLSNSMKVDSEVELITTKSVQVWVFTRELRWRINVINVLDFSLLIVIKVLDLKVKPVSDPIIF